MDDGTKNAGLLESALRKMSHPETLVGYRFRRNKASSTVSDSVWEVGKVFLDLNKLHHVILVRVDNRTEMKTLSLETLLDQRYYSLSPLDDDYVRIGPSE